MNILICGIDGYLGYSLAQHLMRRGHHVTGLDCGLRRKWVRMMGSESIIPIADFDGRVEVLREFFPEHFRGFMDVNISTNPDGLKVAIQGFRPEAVVHLAEQPSAPFSQISSQHAHLTLGNNVGGTLNLLHAMRDHAFEAHLVKLGTLGEYGVPPTPIPEGEFPPGATWIDGTRPGGDHVGYLDGMQFPRKPGSIYHATKVADSVYVEMLCRLWGLRSTDIMQGVVYGTSIPGMEDDDRLRTRFDVDECFGTAINRFVAQTVLDEPMTVFGAGHQKRGFLPLADSMQCLTIAIEQPADPGEYRTWNQFEEVYDITELARIVRAVGLERGKNVGAWNYENPRIEDEDHGYEPVHEQLLRRGYQPTTDMKGVLRGMFADLEPCREALEKAKDLLVPKYRWSGEHRKVKQLRQVDDG